MSDYRIYYDGRCPICIASRKWIEALAWRGGITFRDVNHPREAAELPREAQLHALGQMHVQTPDGRLLGGFDAARALLPRMPLLWPLWPLLHLPGMTWLGRHLYAAIATRRYTLSRCLGHTCRR